MSGWFRLGIFLSLLWIGGVLLMAGYEYRSVSSGGSYAFGFIHLRDSKTGKDLGHLTLDEVKEFGEIAQKRSQSSRGDPGDAAMATLLLTAEPTPYFNRVVILSWLLLPLVTFWAVFAGVRWVVAGFKKTPR